MLQLTLKVFGGLSPREHSVAPAVAFGGAADGVATLSGLGTVIDASAERTNLTFPRLPAQLSRATQGPPGS